MRLIVSDSIWLCYLAGRLGIMYYADHTRQRYYVQFPSADDAWVFVVMLHEVNPTIEFHMLSGIKQP